MSNSPEREQTPIDGRRRAVVEGVQPEVDGGRFPAKRTVGDRVQVEADVYADGHDAVSAVVLHRRAGEPEWTAQRMSHLVNDRWAASFQVDQIGEYEFTVAAWVDRFASWQRDFGKRVAASQDVELNLRIGAELVKAATSRAEGADAAFLRAMHAAMADASNPAQGAKVALDPELADAMFRSAEREHITRYPITLRIAVDRERARFSTWYELFPRSASATPGTHGTFADVQKRLPYVAEMGFDVLYLPPVHPIGRTFRKGKNNRVAAEPGDVGSPWAIGGPEGGHKAIHPDLGTFEDFAALVRAAERHGIEIALDVAFQCSPDHPYVREHPEWFRKRPDGGIQYAENPPKKYQDIYPFDFESPAWESLWNELASIITFWAGRGVRIFRVDNPHTKAFPFWEWAIAHVKDRFPDAIFLSEAFTRPKVMYRLAKLGFTQSYTYFAWKNSRWDIEQYFTELTRPPVREFFRANAWPNTPDILNEHLQHGGRPAFVARLILAATLCASYGIYGPPFELLQASPLEPGSEEYLDSEKYQLRHWDLGSPESLRHIITRVNAIRRANPALQHDRSLRFHPCDNHDLVCYSKSDGDDVLVCVVNLNPRRKQWGTVDLPLEQLGIDPGRPYQLHDLLSDARYTWEGGRNTVGLDPGMIPAHIFRVRRRARTERDFEYFE